MIKFQASALAFLLLGGACASFSATPSASARQADCPALANIDLSRLHILAAENAESRDQRVRELTGATPLPAEAESAATRIRVRVPPTGMWALDNRVTLWRTDDGWRMARQDIDYRRPPPAPPPPRPIDAPADWTPAPTPPEPNEVIREGAIMAEDGAQLDALLNDPCLELEPTRFSHTVPTRRGHDWVCVPDSSYWAAELIQAGQPPRLISIGCENNLRMSALVRLAASARLPPEPEPEPEQDAENRPYQATLEIYGDYSRVIGIGISDWFYSSAAPIIAPGGIWSQHVPVPDGPVSVWLSLRDCPRFNGSFNHSLPVAKLIFEGCDVRLVQD